MNYAFPKWTADFLSKGARKLFRRNMKFVLHWFFRAQIFIHSCCLLSAPNDYTWLLFVSLLMLVLFRAFMGYSCRLGVVGFKCGQNICACILLRNICFKFRIKCFIFKYWNARFIWMYWCDFNSSGCLKVASLRALGAWLVFVLAAGFPWRPLATQPLSFSRLFRIGLI